MTTVLSGPDPPLFMTSRFREGTTAARALGISFSKKVTGIFPPNVAGSMLTHLGKPFVASLLGTSPDLKIKSLPDSAEPAIWQSAVILGDGFTVAGGVKLISGPTSKAF